MPQNLIDPKNPLALGPALFIHDPGEIGNTTLRGVLASLEKASWRVIRMNLSDVTARAYNGGAGPNWQDSLAAFKTFFATRITDIRTIVVFEGSASGLPAFMIDGLRAAVTQCVSSDDAKKSPVCLFHTKMPECSTAEESEFYIHLHNLGLTILTA